MRKVAFVLIAALVAVGCDDDDDEIIVDVDGDGIPDDIDDDIDVELETVWRANLVGIGAFSTLVGDSTVVQGEGELAFNASITLRNDAIGAVRPWHVHFGVCASGGAIVGPADAYAPLVIGSDGAAVSDTLVRVGLDVNAPYHVNVHKSAAELDVIIACGNLVIVAED
jgi:hypothetical protein